MFNGFIGNDLVKLQLGIGILAARKKNDALGHCLFGGRAGCGKTFMSRLVAEELGGKFFESKAENFKTGQLVRDLLFKLPDAGYNEKGEIIGKVKPSVIFIDEIHAMPQLGQESLGIAMEQWRIIASHKIAGKLREAVEWVPHFTLIGATTELGKLTKPFREKFRLSFDFKAYSVEEICRIVQQRAKEQCTEITPAAVSAIAQRSRGIPRLAISLLSAAEDIAIVSQISSINTAVTDIVFQSRKINPEGLTEKDLKLLTILANSERAGLDYLSLMLDTSAKTVSQEIEPYLMQLGFMGRSSGGRFITEEGLAYLQNTEAEKITRRIVEWK